MLDGWRRTDCELLSSGIFFTTMRAIYVPDKGLIFWNSYVTKSNAKEKRCMNRSILVISQQSKIIKTIEQNLVNSFIIFYARTSAQAFEMIMQNMYELILIDISMQDMDGHVMLQIIRRLTHAPILALIQQAVIEERIRILNMGADDCLLWPVAIDEFIIRIEACLKKSVGLSGFKPIIHSKIGLMIDPSRRVAELKKKEVILTKREFDILYLLVSNPGVVFSKEQIYAMIWGEQFVKDESNIMSHIGRLRKKMGEAGKFIETVWGIGYRFAEGGQVEE